MPDPNLTQNAIDAIEAELKHLGWWSSERPPPEAFENMGPFGQNTMAYSQWLQFIFVPRVREAIETETFPSSSSVGAKAIREYDGQTSADRLVDLLCDFDRLFE